MVISAINVFVKLIRFSLDRGDLGCKKLRLLLGDPGPESNFKNSLSLASKTKVSRKPVSGTCFAPRRWWGTCAARGLTPPVVPTVALALCSPPPEEAPPALPLFTALSCTFPFLGGTGCDTYASMSLRMEAGVRWEEMSPVLSAE